MELILGIWNEGRLLFILGLLFTIFFWIFLSPVSRVYRYLDSNFSEDRRWLIKKLGNSSFFLRYQLAISDLNLKLDAFFGTPWSAKALVRCISIALIYPFLFFLLAWLLSGNDNQVTTSRILPDLKNYNERFIVFFSLIGLIGIYFILFRFLDNVRKFVENTLSSTITLFFSNVPNPTKILLKSISFSLSIVLALSVVLSGVGIFAGDFTGAVAGALAGVVVGAYLGAISVLIASMFAIAYHIFEDNTISLHYLEYYKVILFTVFYAILPITNAILDWLSWGVTRFFLARIENISSGIWGRFNLIFELFFDIIAAIFFLVFLACILPLILELMNTTFLSIGLPKFEWVPFLQLALDDPFGKGIMVTGMLLTTLIPTILHLIAGLAGTFLALTPNAYKLTEQIPYDPSLENKQKPMSEMFKEKVRNVYVYSAFWYIPASLISLILFFTIFYILNSFIGSFGQFLVDIAFCSTYWAHGECSWLRRV